MNTDLQEILTQSYTGVKVLFSGYIVKISEACHREFKNWTLMKSTLRRMMHFSC